MKYSFNVKPFNNTMMRFTSIEGKCDFIKNNAVLDIASFFDWIEMNLKNDNVLVSKKALNDSFLVSLLFSVDNFKYEKFDFYFDRSLFKTFAFEHNFLIFFENLKPVNNEQLVEFAYSVDSKFEYTSDYLLRLYHDFCDDSDITIGADFILQPYELLEFCDIFRDDIIKGLTKISIISDKEPYFWSCGTFAFLHFSVLGPLSEQFGLIPTVVTGAVTSLAYYPLAVALTNKKIKDNIIRKFDSFVSCLKRKYFIMSYDDDSFLQSKQNPVLKLEHNEIDN